MTIKDLRKDLEGIRASARAGDMAEVMRTADHALHALDPNRLLTTSEAAELLGLGSVNTLKLMVRQSNLRYEMHGNRMMIPVSGLEQLQESAMLRGIRASDKAHDANSELGADGELTDAELAHLESARPGRLPWKADNPR